MEQAHRHDDPEGFYRSRKEWLQIFGELGFVVERETALSPVLRVTRYVCTSHAFVLRRAAEEVAG